MGVAMTQDQVSDWILRMLKNTTKGTRPTWASRPQWPSSTALCRCTSARWPRFCRLKAWRPCRMLSKRITSSPKSCPPLHVGSLALRCGRLLAVANTSLITMQHVDFEKKMQLEHHPSRDADGYSLDGVDEVLLTARTTE